MRRPFREHHLLQILSFFEEQSLPLDVFLRNYFRTNRSVGSKDRKEICETLYGMIRWRGLLDHIAEIPLSWETRLHAFTKFSQNACDDPALPAHIRVSFPEPFYQLLVSSLGEEKAFQFCLSCNEPAPTTIRVNLLKTTRSALLESWQSRYRISPCHHSHVGIRFKEKINFFGMEEFKKGYFEVQDEASQLIAELIAIEPGMRFLDYCAGSGGKSLAIAPRLKERGQLFLHDIRPRALLEARKRLKRAGIQNAQLLPADSPNKRLLKMKMDWVLVDAPCTGTGTFRRNPDMKWKFEDQLLPRIIQEQREIFEEALSFLKPGGHIVYATCSVLPQENLHQAAYFLDRFPLEQIGEPFSSIPVTGEMDGFFGVVFKKKKD
ncbi:MAG: RsmB/NOP family class I SAM-dependent RNA methyltransferase [Rhabdochlamydiaceae bacterium]